MTPTAPTSRQSAYRNSSTGRPRTSRRWEVAVVLGIAAGLFSFIYQTRPSAAPDFIYPWTAARLLLQGVNPYTALPGGLAAPFQAPLLYPLPAIIAAAPFAPLSLPLAVGAFAGISVCLFAYAVTRDNWDGLLLLVSAPLLLAVLLGQWSPILTATALLPIGGFLAVTKPNLGLALTIYRPSRGALLGFAALLGMSLILLPSWPRDWLHSLALDRRSGTHVAPIMTPFGFVLVLSLLRWRRPEARLLLAMACVPQLLFFYDQLPLLLLAASRLEKYALIVASDIAFLIWMALGHDSAAGPRIAEWCVILGIYLPCLVMLLRRPNEGAVPEWLSRGASSVVRLTRGVRRSEVS